MLCRGPPKGHSVASAISFMNPNQDYLVICKKFYLAFNGPKGDSVKYCIMQLTTVCPVLWNRLLYGPNCIFPLKLHEYKHRDGQGLIPYCKSFN